MLIAIHNLPSHMQYANVRSLIQKECGIKSKELILDNLVNEGRLKRVTVGVTGEKQAETLIRKLNGMAMEGHRLYVKEYGAPTKIKETSRSSSSNQKQKTPPQESQSFASQAQQSQQGFYPVNVPFQPNFSYANPPYMAPELMMPTLMNPPMMGMGGMCYMPPQNPYMGFGGQMQSANDPQHSYSQQVDTPKTIEERPGKKKNNRTVTETQWSKENAGYNDHYQNENDGDMGGSRNYNRDENAYNNRYQDEQNANNYDGPTNERSRSRGGNDNSRFGEERNRICYSNEGRLSSTTNERDRSRGNYYQSARDSRPRSRSPLYEERGRVVSRDRYQDNGRPDDSYQRRDSSYDAAANPLQQFGGGGNPQGFNYDGMDEPQPERYNPMSSDRGNQSSGNRWDKPNNPSPQGRGNQSSGNRWAGPNNASPQSRGPQANRWDGPNNSLPQSRGRGNHSSGNRWDVPNDPLPQIRGVQPPDNHLDEQNNPSLQSRGPQGVRWDGPNNSLPQSRGPLGNRWDEPNNLLPQNRAVPPPDNRWDEPNTPLPQNRAFPPQESRWDEPNNPMPQSGAIPPQGNPFEEPNNPTPQSRGVQPWSVQARERQRSATPKRVSPPLFLEDRNPNSFKGNLLPPPARNAVPPPAKKAAPQKSQESTKALHAAQQNKKNYENRPTTGINTLKRDTSWRKTAASQIAAEIIKLLTQERNRRKVLKAVKDAVFVRIDLILQDKMVPFIEIARRYRQRFPESTDRELLEVIYEKVTHQPLGLAPQTVNSTSADQPGAASTTVASTSTTTTDIPVKEIIKVEIPSDEVTLNDYTADDNVPTLVSDEPKDIYAAPIVEEEIKAEIPKAISTMQPKPVIPAETQDSARLPKYPQGDKQLYKKNKQIEVAEFEDENYYEVGPDICAALDTELNPIVKIFVNELQDASGDEAYICNIMGKQTAKFRKCLLMQVTKRILDIRTNLLLRVFVHGKPPKQPEVEKLLKAYGVVTLKKSDKNGPLYYVAECSSYDGYDELLKIQTFTQDTTTLVIKPYHVAGPPKKAPRKWLNGVKLKPNKKKKRTRYINPL